MVFTRGLGSIRSERHGDSDDEICRIVDAEAATTVKEAIPEVFGSIKTVMIEILMSPMLLSLRLLLLQPP